ncbi:hypothetical protein FKW77_000992 [Venturia effusa]|uniref:Midasin n=1 Tax=Venturia effusa TaxID=50376 RepID=A0A517LGJ5_9PEZI|nr:hypothetical protein FKW77_000992 [Venturia effusa]
MECSASIAVLLSKESQLPHELVDIIRNAPNTTFLAAIASSALNPRYTDILFTHLEPLFAEICARWNSSDDFAKIISAFGRVLPFAPHLSEYAEAFFTRQYASQADSWCDLEEEGNLVELLLGIFRILVFDSKSFAKHLKMTNINSGLGHTSRVVRYLAIRIMCLYMHAADAAMEGMISQYLGSDAILGLWEGKNIDYRFLSLWEEKRWRDIGDLGKELKNTVSLHTSSSSRVIQQADLSDSTVEIFGRLMPRLGGLPSSSSLAKFVPTISSVDNVRAFTEGLLRKEPLLLIGLAGTGKTATVNYCAQQLNKLDSMLTLHLNEQSDAKTLIGMYTSGSTPGTFVWRAGALTTAVREGRWVFIEDLDRAPNEIISTLLPLIERGELLIPSRSETIRAARGFKIIATMRTNYDIHGNETMPRTHMIGSRLWRQVPVKMLDDNELEEVVLQTFPQLQLHVPSIISVYGRLKRATKEPGFASAVKSGSARPLTPRDLLKWCHRMQSAFARGPFSDALLDCMFLEAVDCFSGYLQGGEVFERFVAYIAEELHIDTMRRDHLLKHREVRLVSSEKLKQISIGRVTLGQVNKQRTMRQQFAMSPHTLRLIEKLASAVENREPTLLVGETGIGKTTCVQYLAERLGRKLVSFNLSQQSESGDLLGGFKPVNVRGLVMPLKEEFDDLFEHELLPAKKDATHAKFVTVLGKATAKGDWKRVCAVWKGAAAQTLATFATKAARIAGDSSEQATSSVTATHHPKKKQKVAATNNSSSNDTSGFYQARWRKFAADVESLDKQLAGKSDAFAFRFVEGNIVKAVRNGDWVLLDEINLASPDTLEALVDLLGGALGTAPSLLLTEAGSIERVTAHPNFRVFAAMNPATDVGKKDLAPGIRSRFTELYVDSPDQDPVSLEIIVQSYVDPNLGRQLVSDITNLYQKIQEYANANRLVDGAGQKPHFSLRTLTRTLNYARDVAAPVMAKDGIYRRALYEGFQMSFLTLLDSESEDLLTPLITHYLFRLHKNSDSELKKSLPRPVDGLTYIQEGHHWLRKGPVQPEPQPHYIITESVRRNLNNLIRAVSTHKLPILIQGPTSSGKTSMIEHLAKISGNKFVRINNHEHTDLQEYLGTYMSGTNGKLYFQEGVLVEALKKGYWIVLDELNLAPTDVLEALNRLLDDNRELLIPETQEIVRPHADFMLFATQNPAGLYGGRKHLSRAFRNRFLELHFGDIPEAELCAILHQRTQIPQSWAQRIVDTYKKLSELRQENRLFESKSFATLRDLFRWALRRADNLEQLAVNGYMLLAERVRKTEERDKVKIVIEEVLSLRGPRVRIDDQSLYSLDNSAEMIQYTNQQHSSGVVWTKSMRRLFCLVAHALRNNEPVLLIGETGCGKTTVCQMIADTFGKELFIVNAHQNTETGDLIGSQRPIRNRAAAEAALSDLTKAYEQMEPSAIPEDIKKQMQDLRDKSRAIFEWSDGALVSAMKSGQHFLLDEISLADDSVLERLNSVLESGRSLLLAEKGSVDSAVTAEDGFQFLATMNPGGDYGKKELSPALRNRFTEIWVPSLYDMEDILEIVRAKLSPETNGYADAIVGFSHWFNETYNKSATSAISIRDTLGWIDFINKSRSAEPAFAIMHGAAMVYIDTLGANPAAMLSIASDTIEAERRKCVAKLSELLHMDLAPLYFAASDLSVSNQEIGVGPFHLPRLAGAETDSSFSFTAPTTRSNAMRVFRALQLVKPVLIEGNPGVGKTTLVIAIAKLLGKRLVRINLSEQTDLIDLFGSDVPVDGASVGSFAWRDAPFLSAMKNGDWVLLDEMNLASQSVLEGLNACLDHRAEAYVAELDQTFKRHQDFRLFAAQNPHHQGGGRKGLPASFVNRFSVVHADIYGQEDLLLICKQIFPNTPDEAIMAVTSFVSQLEHEVAQSHKFGAQGCPWEFNLRDTIRWLQLLTNDQGLLSSGRPYDFCDIIFRQRFRNASDRLALDDLFSTVFKQSLDHRSFYHNLAADTYQVGLGLIIRNQVTLMLESTRLQLRLAHLPAIESLILCTQQNWPVILVGPTGSGKTTLIEHLAATAGTNIVTFPMNADIDAMDLVGGYEQADPARRKTAFIARAKKCFQNVYVGSMLAGAVAAESTQAFKDSIFWQQEPSRHALQAIEHWLQAQLANETTAELAELYVTCKALLEEPDQIEKAQFEWVDGLLVKSLESGDWLVLDNANLCSSSVLDRLNSLLEPSGCLSLNEHPLDNGQARVVKPHPSFRIFLTVDPRHGELSRAMRNRAIEIFLLPEDSMDTTSVHNKAVFGLESCMYRYRNLVGLDNEPIVSPVLGKVVEIAADHVSFQDLGLQERFQKQLNQGLVREPLLQSAIQEALHNVHTINADWVSINLNSQQSIHSPLPGQIQVSLWPTASVENIVLIVNLYIQSIHPLNNSILVRVQEESIISSYWLADAFDALLEMSKMTDIMTRTRIEALNKRPLTLFERSVACARFPTKVKDATIRVSSFLEDSLGALKHHVISLLQNVDFSLNVFQDVKAMQRIWWTFFYLVQSIDLDDTVYHVHVSLAQGDLSRLKETCQDSEEFLDHQLDLLKRMNEATALTTGKSMELIWKHFRPQTVTSMERLTSLLSLEALAQKFDNQIFPLKASIAELCKLRDVFSEAIHMAIEEDAEIDDLILELETSIRAPMENLEGANLEKTFPYFAAEFEAICQYFDLPGETTRERAHRMQGLYPQLFLFACRPTAGHLAFSKAPLNSVPDILASIDRYLGSDEAIDAPRAVRQNLGTSLVQRMAKVDTVHLSDVDQLQLELDALGQVASIGSDILCEDQMEKISHVQRVLGTELERIGIQISHVLCSETSSRHALDQSRLWISIALTCIFEYVPDRPFDPALRERIQREVLIQRKNGLRSKLQALEHFERYFSGQRRNLRYDVAEQELHGLPADAAELQIPRPPRSQFSMLQGEFNAVLLVARAVQDHFKTSHGPLDASIMHNISQLVHRLRRNYRAYDDIVVPLIGFLRCLTVGLTLVELASEAGDSESPNTNNVLVALRLLGGSTEWYQMQQCSATSLHKLSLLATAQNVEKANGGRARFMDEAHAIFYHLYAAWKDKMTDERAKYAQSSSLYTFRGDQNEEEQVDEADFNELFPDYDAQETLAAEDEKTIQSPREAAVSISALHSQVFRMKAVPEELVTQLVSNQNTDSGFDGSGQSIAAALPSIYLSIQRVKETLRSGTRVDTSYNIYTDANITEARKLASLVQRIQARFQQLQHIYPEHVTIQDVIRVGHDLLAFAHTEPIAKFITKLEKLYDTMNEWERVASRDLSAASLYDEVTKLIVAWRKLELTTWMRLFDLEMDKCVENVKTWWFVAYENIIAVPLQLMESGIDLTLHATELLRTLEGFFKTATLGQYRERLNLLVQFREHVKAMLDALPKLWPVYSSMVNFIAYYSRFAKPIEETLMQNRSILEKKVKEVVQLASWRDVNIEALKQSAKISHRKLFNLVRKFRTLLDRSVNGIIEEGPPTEAESPTIQTQVNPAVLQANSQALEVCEKSYSDWTSVSPRFKNATATVNLMQDLSAHPRDALDGAEEIRDFLQRLEDDMTSLAKATPSILSEETKDEVKHLKNRKRVCFADVLKGLKIMGFQHNLSSIVLANQDSAALILASTPSSAAISLIKDAEYHFHKTLSLMASARHVQREHSGDLTPAEVTRGIGYLEGILNRLLKQRKVLVPALADCEDLEKTLSQLAALWEHGSVKAWPHPSHDGEFTDMWRTMSWLKSVAQVFIKIVSAQAELGNFDATIVISGLAERANQIEFCASCFVGFPNLPQGVWTLSKQEIVEKAQTTLDLLKKDIEAWIAQLPMLTPVLTQLLPWIGKPATRTNGVHSIPQQTAADTRTQVFASIDQVLASIQDLHNSRNAISVEEASWLTKQDAQHATNLALLRVKAVTATVSSAMCTLQALSSEDMFVAISLFAAVQPILQQYLNIVRYNLDQYAAFHTATAKLSHNLCKAFITIGTRGYCTPPEKAAKDEKSQDEKLEGGTGLGEGEGADDISKDIGDDEDLTELAQEPDDNKGDRDEIEDEKDAVDMADEGMDGEVGDHEEKEEGEDDEGSGDEGEEEGAEDEAGEVDDLGPTTVDEKMWDDGEKPNADKDKEGEQGVASKNDDQVAGKDGDNETLSEEQKEEGEKSDEEQDVGADEEEAVGQEQLEKTDEFLKQEETLELPEDLDMDGSGDEKSDDEGIDNIDDFDDGEEAENAPIEEEDFDIPGDKDDGGSEAEEVGEEGMEDQPQIGAEIDGSAEKEEDQADVPEYKPEDKEGLLKSDAKAAEEAVPSENQGLGTDTKNLQDDQSASNSAAKQDQGTTGEKDDNDTGTAGEQGAKNQSENQEAVGRNDDVQDSADGQPFKKLGDTLEKWYNQQRQIRRPTEKTEAPETERKQDADMADVDFEHLLNEESKAEAQALGAASEEQARTLDGENAMETNDEDLPQNSFPDDEDTAAENEDIEMEDVEHPIDVTAQNKDQANSKSFIGDAAQQDLREHDNQEGLEAISEKDLEQQDVSLTASTKDLTLQDPVALNQDEARQLWSHHEKSTRALSATLTEQLRLILAPTLATKLRGDYRTGKRLNIKRIIPYIASSYKRDKIWMRRAVPSKRNYQVMIAVDDSKSMGEGGSKELAFETLALVSKALALLEVGELCIVGFGQDVKVAHAFDKPFSDEAGVDVFSRFRFNQEGTDVKKLIKDSTGIFAEARAKASGSAQDLWQLMLIVSDAICDNADEIKRLVRKAQEEKIMIVFVVVDAQAQEKVEGMAKKVQSIMDLEQVNFEQDPASGEMRVRRYKYMAEVFPFRWWIVWTRLLGGAGVSVRQSTSKNPQERLNRFKRIYDQIRTTYQRSPLLQNDSSTTETIKTCFQRLTTILGDESRSPAPHLCLSFANSAQIYQTISRIGSVAQNEGIIHEAIAVFGALIDSEEEEFLSNERFAHSLMIFVDRTSGNPYVGEDTEGEIVELLFGIAAKIRLDPEILPVWFIKREESAKRKAISKDTNDFVGVTSKEDFPLCYQLMDHVHNEGKIGDFARTGLLYIFESASKSQELEKWIVASDLPTLMASGLGAVYSQLSRKLSIIHPPEELPIILTLSDYKDLTPPIEAESMFSKDLQDHLTTFVSYLRFWQDVLEHCRSLDVRQTLLDHYQVLYLQQLLYPSMLESSDVDGGSSVAVLTYLRRILDELSNAELVHLILQYLLALPEQGRPRSPTAIKRRTSLLLLTQPENEDDRPNPELFSLADLLHSSISSTNPQTVIAAFKLATVILGKNHAYAIDTLLQTTPSQRNGPSRTHGALDAEIEIYLALAEDIGGSQGLDEAYESHLKDALRLIESHVCSSPLLTLSGLGGSSVQPMNVSVASAGPKDVSSHSICLDDAFLNQTLLILGNFLTNNVEVNLASTEALITIMSCPQVHLEGWVVVEPGYYDFLERKEWDSSAPESLRLLKAARRQPSWSAQHVPLLLSKLQEVRNDLRALRELVPDLDQLVTTRKQAFRLHEDILQEIQTTASRPSRPSVDSPVPFNAGPTPHKLAAIPQRLYNGASPSTPSRSQSPRGRPIQSDRKTAPTSSPTPSILGQYAPGLASPGSESSSRSRPSRDSRRGSSTDPRSAEVAPEELLRDIVDTANSAALAKRIKFPLKPSAESEKVVGKPTRGENNEDGDEGCESVNEKVESREASLGHIITNAVILQEFILELVAIMQVRASMFGEVRFA